MLLNFGDGVRWEAGPAYTVAVDEPNCADMPPLSPAPLHPAVVCYALALGGWEWGGPVSLDRGQQTRGESAAAIFRD